ncbi:hypothetical protein [Embleya sp. NPDC001921]
MAWGLAPMTGECSPLDRSPTRPATEAGVMVEARMSTTGRMIVGFAVRCDYGRSSYEEVAVEVSKALGCEFQEGVRHRSFALMAEVLGVTLALSPWRGMGGKRTLRLDGEVTETGFVEHPGPFDFTAVDISTFLADLLNIRTGRAWYVPTPADYAAESAHALAIDAARE